MVCCRCERVTDRPVLVRVIESGSGPGGMHYACPDDARWYATLPDAPRWLRGEVRALADEEYRSVACRLGRHRTCRDGEETEPPCEGVTVLRCVCPCHRRDGDA